MARLNLKTPAKGEKTLKKQKITWESYQAPSALELPEELVEALYNQGFVHSWKRFLTTNTNGTEIVDTKQLRKLTAEKWIPITHTELSNMGDFGGISDLWEHAAKEYAHVSGWVVSGDVALMKREIEYDEAHKEFKLKKAWDQVRGAHNIRQLRSQTHGDFAVEDEGTHIRLKKPRFREEAVEVIEEE